ncbi:MAG TPA: hypothetical protein VHZ51_31765 [Ktedonobacteraceae bacterium]|nr:hypothetical protein [Ktedonobacteraceae bacterium]
MVSSRLKKSICLVILSQLIALLLLGSMVSPAFASTMQTTPSYYGYDQGNSGNSGINHGNNQDNSGNSGNQVNNQRNIIGTQINNQGTQVNNNGSTINHQVNYINLLPDVQLKVLQVPLLSLDTEDN